jgi:hypothetical protein
MVVARPVVPSHIELPSRDVWPWEYDEGLKFLSIDSATLWAHRLIEQWPDVVTYVEISDASEPSGTTYYIDNPKMTALERN